MGRVTDISLPTGGGALRGTGETVSADPSSGTLSAGVPLDLPEVGGLRPNLSLQYSSTAGSGIAGLGWDLPIARIARRTDRGVPTYTGSDTFVLTGAEELVEVPVADATLPNLPDGVTVTRYRPRVESGHARILRITGAGQDYWEVWNGDGWRQRFGTRRPAEAGDDWVDPAAIVRPGGGVHAWLLSHRWDSLIGDIRYAYRRDPGGALVPHLISYGWAELEPPGIPGPDGGGPAPEERRHLVTVEFGYRPRADVVTDRRPGFAVATTLLLERVTVHVGGEHPLREFDLTHRAAPGTGNALLTGLQVTGIDDEGRRAPRAPLTFGYTAWEPERHRFRLLQPDLPEVRLGDDAQLLDLFGDGMPSVVSAEATPRYWRSLGEARFDLPRSLTGLPLGGGVSALRALEDVDGDGRPEAYVATGTGVAVYSLAEPGPRAGFDPVPLNRRVALPTTPPGATTHELDLDGRHVRDLVVAGRPAQVARADGRGGFTALRPLVGAPAPLTAAADQRVRTVDLTGDGLTDVVQIDDGRVTYWPSLGHGRFDTPVVMAGSPRFAERGHTLGYDPARLLVGDLTGDGCADLAYVGDGVVTVWLNRGGRSFAPPVVLRGMPQLTDRVAVTLADLTGTGIRGIVWTGVGSAARWAWLEPTGGTKPFLLASTDNGVGARTEVTWSTSTRHAATDRAVGRPWQTTVPFPVHVVDEVRVSERFTGTVRRTRHSYHDGCWDPVEREWRGFGRVDVAESFGGTDVAWPPPVVRALDPLTEARALPVDFDATPHGNLLSDWSFDEAGDAWQVTGDGALQRVASTLPSGRGGRMARVSLPVGAHLEQRVGGHRGPVVATAWVRVRSGRLVLGIAGAEVSTGPTDEWVQVEVAATLTGAADLRFASGDGADSEPTELDADIDHVWLRAAPELDRPAAQVVTTSWFHLGPVPRPRGSWTHYAPEHDFWAGDPAWLPAVVGGLAGTDRNAARALRGRVIRTEVRVIDDNPAASIPHAVTENSLEVRAIAPGCAAVRARGTRTTTWERGDDPATTVSLAGDFDEYDRPRAAVRLGVPRGRDPRAPGAPVLGTVTRTRHATRDDEVQLRTELTAREVRRAIVDDGTRDVLSLGEAAVAGEADGELLGVTWQRYDGEPFVGLPIGELGAHGLPAAGDSLAMTTDTIAALCAATPDRPAGQPWPTWLLPPTGLPDAVEPDSLLDRLPDEVRARVLGDDDRGPHAGYRWVDDGELSGWAVPTGRARYDGSGLPVETLDAWGGRTLIEWDPHGILPVAVTDAAGLTTTATIHPRLFVHDEMVDPNGAATRLTFGALGLVTAVTRLGRPGHEEGDEPDRPGVMHDYDLFPAPGEPIRSTTRTRVRFSSEEPADEDETRNFAERFVTRTTYADGFGRALQTRSTADTVVATDLGLSGTPGETTRPMVWSADPDRVVVDGEVVRDARGDVVLDLVVRFDQGHAYQPLTAELIAATPAARTVTDPLGRPRIVVAPDGTQTRTTIESPWVTVTHDAVACAGWSNPTWHLDQAHRWGDRETVEVDALGRPVLAVEHAEGRDRVVNTTVDVDGRVLAVGDRTGGTAIRHRYDLLGREWLTWTPAGGTLWVARDALGAPVEQRDSRDAGLVTVHDAAHRLVATWGTEDAESALTPRTRVRFGDEPGMAVPGGLGRVVASHDDAGVASVLEFRFDGQPLQTRRQIVRTDLLLADRHREADSGEWPDEWLGDQVTETVTRDVAGNVLRRVTDVSGREPIETVHEWDRSGLLVGVVSDGEVQLAGQTRDAQGRRTSLVAGDGVLVRELRDADSEHLRRRHVSQAERTEGGWRPRGPVVQDEAHRWDAIGAITAVETRSPGCGTRLSPDRLVRRFARDGFARLTAATGREVDRPSEAPWRDGPRSVDVTVAREYREAYEYDDNDVLLVIAHHASDNPAVGYRREFTLDDAGRVEALRTGSTTIGYAYDAAGNAVAEGESRTFEWDVFGQLVGARTSAGAGQGSMRARYRQDAAGARVVRMVRGLGRDVELTVTLGEVERMLLVADDGAVRMFDELVVRAGEVELAAVRLGEVFAEAPLHDQRVLRTLKGLGGGAVIVSGAGEALSWEDYTPFGETSFGGHARARYRYGGRPRDVETGLQHFGARHYAPWLGRWLSPDPAGVVDGPNLYGYAKADPVTLVDPSGLSASGSWPAPEEPEPPRTKGQQVMEWVAGVLTHPNVTGSLQIASGLASVQRAAGLLAVPEPTFLTKAAAVASFAIGADSVAAGVTTIVTQQHTDTLLFRAISSVATWSGASPDTATIVATVSEMVAGSIGGLGRVTNGTVTRNIPPPAKPLPKPPPDATDVPPGITRNAAGAIDRSAVRKWVSPQKQAEHVQGTAKYKGGGYFTSEADAQKVLDDFHSGAAEILGMKGKDIVVRTKSVTGYNHNPGTGHLDQPTDVFFIKGTKSVTVVPYNPAWKPRP